MTPSRQSREQNNYFDKSPELLRERACELGKQAIQAFELYLGLVSELQAVERAIAENGVCNAL